MEIDRIVVAEGRELHAGKIRVMRESDRQIVTGLVVNGGGAPRAPRELRRRVRSAIHDGVESERLGGTVAWLRGLERAGSRCGDGLPSQEAGAVPIEVSRGPALRRPGGALGAPLQSHQGTAAPPSARAASQK